MIRLSSTLTVRQWLSRTGFIAFLLTIATTTLLPAQTLAKQQKATDEKQRRIFVPIDDLNILLLEGNSNRVLMTDQEYQKLLEDAKQKEIRLAPENSAVINASYEGEIQDGIALIRGSLTIRTLNDGPIAIPLQIGGVAIRQASIGENLQRRPASLYRDAQGQLFLLTGFDEVGEDANGEAENAEQVIALTIKMMVPITTTAARQSLSFLLPTSSATELKMKVPGNVEVKSGVSVVKRAYIEEANVTEFELLPQRKTMNIVMSLNNKKLKDEQVVVARAVSIHELTPHDQQLHTTCSVDVINGAVEQFSFKIPAGHQVESVDTRLLSQWSVETGQNDKKATLNIELREATREDFVINVKTSRNQAALGTWTAEPLVPVDVAGQVTVVGIIADSTLLGSNLTSDAVIPIDYEFLLAAIPPTLEDSSSDTFRIVGAFYSPQPDYKVGIDFEVPAPELILESNTRVMISDQKLTAEGGLQVTSRYDTRVDLAILLPEGWRMTAIEDENNRPFKFVEDPNRAERIVVQLPRRLTEIATRLYFSAEKTPDNWLDPWTTNEVTFSGIQIENQTSHEGSVAVATNEDLTISPLLREGLELLEEAGKVQYQSNDTGALIAYEFEAPEYSLKVSLARTKPIVLARSVNYFSILPQSNFSRHEIIFNVKRAGEDTFVFDLPLSTPKSINIQSANRTLKDSTSEEIDDVRRWTVQLAQKTKGTVHLVATYDVARTAELKEEVKQELSPVIINDVQLQNSFVVIEGSSELDTKIENPGRVIDLGELSGTTYQTSRQVLGAFAWQNETTAVSLSTKRRSFFPLPSAIVQTSDLVSVVSTDGKLQTAAKFSLVTKQLPFLEVELPVDSTLWSVQLDGQPAKPQRQGDRLLISLVGGANGQMRELQFVYETPIESLGLVGDVRADAPIIRVNRSSSDSDDWENVPLVDSNWRLVVPKGYTVTQGNGPVGVRPTVIETLSNWSVALGGGIFELISPQFSMATTVDNSMSMDQPSTAILELEEDESINLRGGIALQEGLSLSEQPSDQAPAVNLPSRTPILMIPPGPPVQKKKDEASSKAFESWAIQGLRSLNIQLNDSTNAVEFNRLDGSTMNAKLVNTSRVVWLASGITVLLLGISMLMTNASNRMKFIWLITLLIMAQALSFFTSAMPVFDSVIEMILFAALLSLIYYIVAGTLMRISSRLWRVITRTRLPIGTAVLILLMLAPATASAQQVDRQDNAADRPPVLNDISDLESLLRKFTPGRKIQIPDDTILIPYDPDAPNGRERADKVLIPYNHFLALQKEPTAATPKLAAPAEFSVSSSSYVSKLESGEDEVISGSLTIDVMTDGPVAVPLRFIGGAFANATLDGQPAKLQFIETTSAVQAVRAMRAQEKQQQLQQESRLDPKPPTVLLHLTGKGQKTFDFDFRVKPQQQGGWRLIRCELPTGSTRGIVFKTSQDPIEIRVNSDADRRVIESKEQQDILSVINPDGSLNVQWKPASTSQQIDQALTVNSDAVFDIREDGLRLNWHLGFEFRGAERSTFLVNLPEGYLVEQVLGENIRSWNVVSTAADESARLDVELLGSAKGNEQFVVELSKRDFALTTEAKNFSVPFLSVPSAALHKGTVSIRRSSIVDLKAGKTSSANRVDASTVKHRIDMKRIDTNRSPLGIQAFQDFQFQTTPFAIDLTANVLPESIVSDTTALLKIGQSKFDMEAKINIDIKNRPLYQLQFYVPQDFEITKLSANANETWSEKVQQDRKLVTVLFPNGLVKELSFFVAGTLTSFTNVPEDFAETLDWSVPQLDVVGAESQTVELAIQSDPAINVVARDLKNLENVSIRNFNAWLAPEQRSFTRLGLKTLNRLGSASPEASTGTLRLNRVRPRIDVESVTNVRTTLLAIEETMLLDFKIQNAGVRELAFELPVLLRDARINARLVSETVITDIENSDQVLVTLKLQDNVIGDYRVVVEFDRELPEGEQIVQLPRVRTGTVKSQFITLQNAGRDEINIVSQDGMQRLNRQLRDYTTLKNKLAGAELTLAFANDKSTETPSLKFKLNTREVLDTVAASIGFSKTTMVVDHDGTYRSQQVFQVNNRSEQYLDIVVPDNATVLSVIVDDLPVKPVRWPDPSVANRVRIPLLKTAAGDLDYPVSIKYGGKLGSLSSFQEAVFPVIETLNINVQLSQLHLRLPESHRWLRFGGTMTQVDEAGELEQDFLTYQSRQIQKLTEQFETASSQSFQFFSKQRAYRNLEKLNQKLDKFADSRSANRGGSGENSIKMQIAGNAKQIQSKQVQLEKEFLEQDKVLSVDNRSRFNQLVESQDAQIATNQITRNGSNFDSGITLKQNYSVQVPSSGKGELALPQSFDKGWFKSNKFGELPAEDTAGDKGRKSKADQQLARSKIAILGGKISPQQQGQAGEGKSGEENQKRGSLSFRNPMSRVDPSGTKEIENKPGMDGRFGNGKFSDGERAQRKLLSSKKEQGFWEPLNNAPRSATPFDVNDPLEIGGDRQDFVENLERRIVTQNAQTRQTADADNAQGAVDGITSGNSFGPGSGDFGGGGQGERDQRGLRIQNDRSKDMANEGFDIPGRVGLTSLDIELPERGVDFYFRSPRGNVNVTAVPMKQSEFRSWLSLGLVVGLVIILWLTYSIFARTKNTSGRVALGVVVAFAGLCSMCSGFLPAFGVLAIVASIGILIGE